MNKSNSVKRVLTIVALALLIISLGSEYNSMAKQTNFLHALGGLIFFFLVVGGFVYWHRKSKKG
jgi:p-aminobenzoyl-glutamate transporter AbgT